MTDKLKTVFQLKIQKRIQCLLLKIFSEGDMSLGDKKFSISVMDIDISPDLKNLKVSVDIMNIDKKDKLRVIKNLNNENVFVIKKLIAEKINLKYVPDVFFVLDETNDKLFVINEMIRKEAKSFK
jgi:ribosome-binding factor A